MLQHWTKLYNSKSCCIVHNSSCMLDCSHNKQLKHAASHSCFKTQTQIDISNDLTVPLAGCPQAACTWSRSQVSPGENKTKLHLWTARENRVVLSSSTKCIIHWQLDHCDALVKNWSNSLQQGRNYPWYHSCSQVQIWTDQWPITTLFILFFYFLFL